MRIGIVNDLPLVCEALRRIVESVPGHAVAWIARDGKEAVAACRADTPDVVLMDLIMPVMDGVESTRQIMQATPCAILIVTVSVGKNAHLVFEAMGHGALDAVDTPTLDGEESIARFQKKLSVIGRLIGTPQPRPERQGASTEKSLEGAPLLAIGASTGGPRAVAKLLTALPKDLNAAIVIVQHVDAMFAEGLASWLKQHSGRDVKVATPGVRPAAGDVLIAGTDDHRVMSRIGTLRYSMKPARSSYRPSVDVFFETLAEHWAPEADVPRVAVVLTGMGRDGAQGLKRLREEGWHTIAQDENSSVVYGMPKAAVEIDAAAEQMDIEAMAKVIAERFAGGASKEGGK